jgi:hypothetical protein
MVAVVHALESSTHEHVDMTGYLLTRVHVDSYSWGAGLRGVDADCVIQRCGRQDAGTPLRVRCHHGQLGAHSGRRGILVYTPRVHTSVSDSTLDACVCVTLFHAGLLAAYSHRVHASL